MLKEFDVLTHPLCTGSRSLIEASAGTGKTTALENLVLRLLIDGIEQPDGTLRQVGISEILLVTFTEAATAELIQRVRLNISRAIELLKAGEFTGTEFTGTDVIAAIIANSCRKADKSREQIAAALRVALLSFDENAISTIHGFCRKMLSNFTFESNSRFNLELITDDRPFLEEVVNDYWRARFYNINDELEAKIIKDAVLTPGGLYKLLKSIQSAPLTEISKPDIQYSIHESYSEFMESCSNSQELLYALKDKINNFKGGFKKELNNALDCFTSFNDVSALAKALNHKLSAADIRLRPKPSWEIFEDKIPAENSFPKDFDRLVKLAGKFERSIENYLINLKLDFIKYARESGILKQKKLNEGVLSFDDLLMDMYEAVNRSERFCELIRQDFPVVMLDEFQDTDPLQFRIFNRIFANEQSLMVMVGDPKQSIYQFRGADIFSYLQVSENLNQDEKSTLTKNYRSEAGLLAGINTIFDIENPFIEKDIRYSTALAGREQSTLIIEDGSDNSRKLKIMTGGEVSAKGTAWKFFNKAVCSKIVSILELAGKFDENGRPRARFENNDGSFQPVRARDIAVLTARNKDAEEVYEQLARLGVPATLHENGNIFEADEAAELLHLFNAIIQPGSISRVKSALATNLFGLNALELEKLDSEDNPAELEAWQEMFFTFLVDWQEKGFIQMFFRLLRCRKTNVRANLLSLPRGERRLTNLLQLMELLHRQAIVKQLSPTALIYWLHQQINNAEEKEEYELRLESDESAVKIMTVHKSKGLQFPLVFCPNLWQAAVMGRGCDEKRDFFYHSEENGSYKQYFEMDFSGDDVERHRLQHRREALGELVRLSYVALTRARNYCCFSWLDIKSTVSSGLGYLAACPNAEELETLLSTGEEPEARRGWEKWKRDRNMEVIELSVADIADENRLSRKFDAPEWKTLPELKNVSRDWGIMSFSAITEGRHGDTEFRPGDDDEEICEENIPDESLDLFARILPLGDFPRGAVAGNCIHSIFEKFTFSDVKAVNWRRKKTVEKMIKEQLSAFGMIDGGRGTDIFEQSEIKRCNQVCDMLENVLTCSLPGRDGKMRLCDLPATACRPEMQFFFPADKILDSDLINELLKHLSGRKSNLPATPLRGFVNGFIDLVFEWGGRFYIIDWKSNDLGGSLNDYSKAAMAGSMYESYYYLQAAIYLLALHKYLKNRLPDYDFEKHLGGVFYVYVRGVSSDFPENGVYGIKPEEKILELLERIF